MDENEKWQGCIEYLHKIASKDEVLGVKSSHSDLHWFVAYVALASIAPLFVALFIATEVSYRMDPMGLVADTSAVKAELISAVNSIIDKDVADRIKTALGSEPIRKDFAIVNEYVKSSYLLVGMTVICYFFAFSFLVAINNIYERSLEKQMFVNMEEKDRESAIGAAIEYRNLIPTSFMLVFVPAVLILCGLKYIFFKYIYFDASGTPGFLPGALESNINSAIFIVVIPLLFLTVLCTFYSALTTNLYARRYPSIRKHSTELYKLHIMWYHIDTMHEKDIPSVWTKLSDNIGSFDKRSIVDPYTTASSLKNSITRISVPLIVLYGLVLIVLWLVFNYLVSKHNLELEDKTVLYTKNWEQILMASADGWLFIIAIGLTTSLFYVYLLPIIRLNPYLEAEKSIASEKDKAKKKILKVEFESELFDLSLELQKYSNSNIDSNNNEKKLLIAIGANEDRLNTLLESVKYGGGFHEAIHGALQGSSSDWAEKIKLLLGTFSPTLLVGLLSLL